MNKNGSYELQWSGHLARDPFAALPAKDRTPNSARVLDQWVQHASTNLGTRADRTGWILASTDHRGSPPTHTR